VSLFNELRRRNVFRVAAAYLVAAWLLLQIVDVIGPILGLPDTIARYLLFLLAVGFIPAVVFAWAFELTPEGVRRESDVDRAGSVMARSGHRLDRAIMVVLALAVGFLLFDKLVLQDGPGGPDSRSARNTLPESSPFESRVPFTPVSGESVAVLPFIAMSNGPDDNYFADGLTEEIINALAQLPDLLVTARTSAFHFKGQNLPVSDIAGKLGVNRVVEGSVRRAGEQLRITAQLIRAGDGFHLWSETYDRRTEDTFAVQEDIAEKVALALNVVLDEASRERMRRAGTGNVEAFTEYQKGRERFIRAHDTDNMVGGLRQANVHFEKAIALAPEIPDAYNGINDLHSHILINNAIGILDGNVSEQDVQNAPATLRRNFDLSIRYARNEYRKVSTQLDRAITLGNWSGLADLTRHALVNSGCMPSYWIQLTSTPWGMAEEAYSVFRNATLCDPHRTSAWAQMARAQLWQGDYQGVEATAREASEKFESDNGMLLSALVLALADSGRVEEAQQVNNSKADRESLRILNRVTIAANQGDAALATGLQKKYLESFGPDDSVSLTLEAMRGNRNEANRLARLIDSRPGGYLALMMTILRCSCGAPFDLEAAPDFAARLGESGLSWPPPITVSFPLKNW
jgi:TolB-like protein